MNASLAGRVALVTGAGRGIGAATASRLAGAGARVCLVTRSEAPGRETLAAIAAAGGEAMLVAADVGSRAACADAVGRAVARWGRLDVLVHNAAHIPYAALDRMADEAIDKLVDVGLKAAFWLTAAALPHLRASPAGRILVTTSGAGNRGGVVGLVHYGAVKAGLTGFVRGAALELAREGITVNAVEPGLIRSASLERSTTPEGVAAMSAAIPIPRPGEPDEVGAAFLYLASDDAAYVTGQVLVVNGGAGLGETGGLPLDLPAR